MGRTIRRWPHTRDAGRVGGHRGDSDWNGSAAVNDRWDEQHGDEPDRAAGEDVASYAITAGSFTTPERQLQRADLGGGQHAGDHASALTATVANQTKTYGVDDPALAGWA